MSIVIPNNKVKPRDENIIGKNYITKYQFNVFKIEKEKENGGSLVILPDSRLTLKVGTVFLVVGFAEYYVDEYKILADNKILFISATKFNLCEELL